MPTPEVLPQHLLALMYAPEDAVIIVCPDGWAAVARAHQSDGRVVYSRARLLSDGVVPTPEALAELADRLTGTLVGWELVA
ncbi:hypothetical protein HDA32_000018 [Spinactinospora alkalitolerans]|uniref:Uncharacterized protein n=1 Tax=Spinactinospora alkalitolerans TaxID=687207 RepID=A0A852TLT7_9ACTN|nr:hypothetical protein [Spinactinospora alkalitolerans]NYE44898.1 hypothetical protein [Spinactinospora alkalitolerans]